MLYARFSVSADAAAFCRRCFALAIIVYLLSDRRQASMPKSAVSVVFILIFEADARRETSVRLLPRSLARLFSASSAVLAANRCAIAHLQMHRFSRFSTCRRSPLDAQKSAVSVGGGHFLHHNYLQHLRAPTTSATGL